MKQKIRDQNILITKTSYTVSIERNCLIKILTEKGRKENG